MITNDELFDIVKAHSETIKAFSDFNKTATDKLLDHQQAIHILISEVGILASSIEKLALAVSILDNKIKNTEKQINEIRKTPLV